VKLTTVAGIAGFILAVAAVAMCAGPTPETTPAAAPSSSSAPALRIAYPLLGGLREGDAIDDFTVDKIAVTQSTTQRPRISVELGRKGSGLTIWISRKEDVEKPPRVTQKYALTYGDARLYGEPLPSDANDRMLAKIAERVEKNEATTPPGF
jgi:hypothetical protein